jgi:hypothetical protein
MGDLDDDELLNELADLEQVGPHECFPWHLRCLIFVSLVDMMCGAAFVTHDGPLNPER